MSHCDQGSVLVVEDNLMVAEVTDQLLRALGYAPIMTRGAREALEMLKLARVDMVFSDVVMPGELSGFELARRIRARFPKLPILLTTGYSEALVHAETCEFPVLNKPYQLEDLSAALMSARVASARGAAKPH
ncbi:MAG TPA: response regulator [Caulobacteraceae bacterium]|jgi:CheY-like chemotaxis protein